MAPYIFKSILSLIGTVKAYHGDNHDLARGWGDDIEWEDLGSGQRKASDENKPMMVIVHKTGCPACGNLRGRVSNGSRVRSLSQNFVMVNLDTAEGEVPRAYEFAPDGNYVPRVIFFTPKGSLIQRACNMDLPEYKYTYQDEGNLARVMNMVIGMGF